MRSTQKLSRKYFGPYKILGRIGAVAYKVKLPPTSQVHPIFHVSLLKVLVGNVPTSTQLPWIVSDVLIKEP